MKIPIKLEVELKEDSKSLRKLLDVVSTALGWVGIPLQKHLENRVEDAAIVSRAKADVEAADLRQVAQIRRDYLELRRTKNIRSIVQGSVPLLADKPSDEPVDEDWSVNFFEQAQDISDSEMQSLWSRILAEEVNKPGNFSLRTLNFLKTMMKFEVEIFTRICSFSWTNASGTPFLMDSEVVRRHWDREGRINSSINSVAGIEHSKNIGLLGSELFYGVSSLVGQPNHYFGRTFVFDLPAKEPPETESATRIKPIELIMGFNYFSQIGADLRKIANSKPIDGYPVEAMEHASKELRIAFHEVTETPNKPSV